jgi:hypothetical protein
VTDTALTTVIDNVLTHLNTHLTEVDYTSRTEYFPTIQTGNTALLAMPFGTSTVGEYFDVSGRMRLSHRVPFEFWIKHINGQASTSTAAAFDLGYKAIRVLQDHDDTNFSLTPGEVIEYTVDANPTIINNMYWLVATLSVPLVTYQEAA